MTDLEKAQNDIKALQKEIKSQKAMTMALKQKHRQELDVSTVL